LSLSAVPQRPWPRALGGATRKAGLSGAEAWGRRFVVLVLLGWLSSAVIGFNAAILGLSVIGLLAAIVGLGHPIVGLFGIGILCTLDVLSRVFGGGVWRWNTFNYWLLVVILLHGLKLLWRPGTELRIFRLFLLFLVLGLALSGDVPSGAQHILDGMAMFGLLVYFRRVSWTPELARALAMVTGVAAAAGGLAFLLVRSRLAYVNPNAWSFVPLTAIFAACLAVGRKSQTPRQSHVLLSLVGVNVLWVFLSGSRGGLLIAAACVAFLVIQQIRRSRGGILPLVVAGMLALGVGSVFVEQESRTSGRVTKLFDASASLAERTSGRSDLALGAWYIVLDHPFGVGTGGFRSTWAALGSRAGLSGFGEGSEVDAHAGWAKTLAENGFVGIAVLGAFVLSFAFVGWHRGGIEGLIVGGLVTVVLSLGFVVTEFQSKGLWFLAAGVMARMRAERLVAGKRRSRRRESTV
jgi:hypothetical protein